MEVAAAAMEKVPLVPQSSDEIDETPPDPSLLDPTAPPVVPPPSDSEIGALATEGPPNLFDRFLLRVHSLFYRLCHVLGHLCLRMLSTFMLLSGIIGSVVFNLRAYYYTGVLNPWLFLACVFMAPTLASVAVIREEMLLYGTSRTGTGPRMSQFVSFAYLIMMICAFASLLQPLILHGEGEISGQSFWLAWAAVVMFYYSLLVSEVLFASALNLRRAKLEDDETRRREREDPSWMVNYNAIHS